MERKKENRFFATTLLAILCLLGLGAFDSAAVHGQKTKRADYGTLRVNSDPAGLLLEVDGKAYGETTRDYLTIEHLLPGLHTVVVTLPDGSLWRKEIDIAAGRVKCITLGYLPPPALISSVCPFPVNIAAPTQVTDGTIVTYSANVSYAGKKPLIYKWTVSPATARILKGAGTSDIEIDTTGLAGQRVTASVIVDDGSGEIGCRQIAQAATSVPPIEQRSIASNQFDICCGCASDDQKARLDNLAIELQNNPATTTYVIVYAARNSQQAHASGLLNRLKDYLVSKRGIDPSRVVTLDGGSRDEDCMELWVVPRGAVPPVPKP